MEVAIVTAVWKRHPLERLTLQYWHDIKVPGHRFRQVVVGSEGLASMAIAPCDALYIEAPNSPLSRKWDYGIMAARLLDVDAVMLVNSDGILNVRAIELLLDGLKGADWSQPDGVWMWDARTNRLKWFEMDTGSGRVFSRDLLSRMDWKVWNCDANMKLDGRAMDQLIQHRARRHEVRNLRKLGGVVLDIKTGINLWSYDEMDALLEPQESDETIEGLLAQCELADRDGFIRSIREFAESTYLDVASATKPAIL